MDNWVLFHSLLRADGTFGQRYAAAQELRDMLAAHKVQKRTIDDLWWAILAAHYPEREREIDETLELARKESPGLAQLLNRWEREHREKEQGGSGSGE